MLTLPTGFTDLKSRQANGSCWILSLTTSTSIFRMSTRALDLQASNGITVEAWVQDFGSISHGVNLDSHVYEPGNTVVRLCSLPGQRNAAGEWMRVADRIQTSLGRNADIHWYPGGYAGWFDCLQIFSGKVMRIRQEGDGGLVLELDERLKVNHVDLPQRKATISVFPKLSKEMDQAALPLVYGATSEGDYHYSTGFNLGLPVTSDPTALKYVIADHPASIGEVWIKIPQLGAFAKTYAGVTKTPNDGGRATVTIDLTQLKMYVYLYPTGVIESSGLSDPANVVTPSSAFDNDSATKLSLIETGFGYASAQFRWEQSGSPSNQKFDNDVASFYPDGSLNYGIELFWTLGPGRTLSWMTIALWDGANWIQFDTSAPQGSLSYRDFGTYDWANAIKGVFWHLKSGGLGGDGTPFKINFTVFTDAVTPGDVDAYIHEIRLRIKASRPMVTNPRIYGQGIDKQKRWAWPIHPFRTRMANQLEPPMVLSDNGQKIADVFAESNGRTYGSWIDNPGRTNAANAGDIIGHPVGVIESILRDEIGLTMSDIDEASFDACYSLTLYEAFANPNHSRSINSEDLITQICWEFGLFLYRSESGKLRIVDYLGTVGSLVALLTPQDLSEMPAIETHWPKAFANQLTVFHTRLPHDGTFHKNRVAGDATSATTYGAVLGEVQCEMIREQYGGTLRTQRLVDRLVGGYGYLSRPHFFVTLKTIGPKFVHAEIGDKFQLDSVLFNETYKAMGQGWGAADLLIYHKTKTEQGVTFDCIIWNPAPM